MQFMEFYFLLFVTSLTFNNLNDFVLRDDYSCLQHSITLSELVIFVFLILYHNNTAVTSRILTFTCFRFALYCTGQWSLQYVCIL